MVTDDNSMKMGLQQRQTLHRKRQESSSKTGTVSSLVPSTRSNFSQRTMANYGTIVVSRNYAEIGQKVVNTSIPCPENAQQPMAAPTFLSLIEIDLM